MHVDTVRGSVGPLLYNYNDANANDCIVVLATHNSKNEMVASCKKLINNAYDTMPALVFLAVLWYF